MPLLKVNIDGSHPLSETRADLKASLCALPKTAPVIICIHGYKFSPFDSAHDPHGSIFSLRPSETHWKVVSWPRALGFGAGATDEGLCINVAWHARGSIWQAYEQAQRVGETLARLIWELDRPVNLIGHSLGARVALAALPHLPSGAVKRAILLAAAEFRSTAENVLQTDAGRAAEFINVSSRENDLYDLMAELALRPDHGRSRTLGSGLGAARRNWCDLQIDHEHTRHALQSLGYHIPAPQKRVCHWSPYVRSGLFDLYRTALCSPEQLPLDVLKTLAPSTPTPRYSRLFAPQLPNLSLPYSRNASS